MTYIDGYQDGQFAGKNDANKGNWFVGGLFLGLISVIVAAVSSPPVQTPPSVQSSTGTYKGVEGITMTESARTNEYHSGYVQGYISARKNANLLAAVAGWITGTVILVIIWFVLIHQAIEETTFPY